MSNVNEIIEAYKRGLEDGRKETQKSNFPQYPQYPYGGIEITYAGSGDPMPRVEERTDGTYVDGVRISVPKYFGDETAAGTHIAQWMCDTKCDVNGNTVLF